MSNLEPINEEDLNLKEKFLGGGEASKVSTEENPEQKAEVPTTPEQTVERKEGAVEKDETYNKILSKVASPAPVVHGDVPTDADAASQEKDAESKITNLVNLAQMKGIAHAVKVAQHLEDNYVLDEFHDRLLSDELHDALVKKGLIKEL